MLFDPTKSFQIKPTRNLMHSFLILCDSCGQKWEETLDWKVEIQRYLWQVGGDLGEMISTDGGTRETIFLIILTVAEWKGEQD